MAGVPLPFDVWGGLKRPKAWLCEVEKLYLVRKNVDRRSAKMYFRCILSAEVSCEPYCMGR